MRTALAWLVVTALLTGGCGAASSAASGPSESPRPTRSAAPSLSPPGLHRHPAPHRHPRHPPAPHGIPDDFSLAAGLPVQGATSVTGPARNVEGMNLEYVCQLQAWPGRAVDREYVDVIRPDGEAIRELATYRDDRTAAAVVAAVRAVVAHCPSTGGSAADRSTFTPAHTDAGQDSYAFAATQRDGQNSVLMAFTRVGDAVLLSAHEGAWSQADVPTQATQLTEAERSIVRRMCVFTAHGC